MNTGAPSLAIESAPQLQLNLTLRNRFAILSNEEKDFPMKMISRQLKKNPETRNYVKPRTLRCSLNLVSL